MMRDVCVGRRSVLALVGGLTLVSLPTEAAGPFQYHSVTPCRLADTRLPGGPSGGPILRDQQVRTFPVQGLCEVPVGAAAVSVNVTAVGPTGAGFLTLFPTGIPQPTASNLNFSAGEPALGNGAIVPLGVHGSIPDLSVFPRVAGGGTVHMVLDVTGYFQ